MSSRSGRPRSGSPANSPWTPPIHAGASIISRAARKGVSLEGTDLYVTTFPCPACARLIAESGIARCFFTAPYSLLEGDEVLRTAGVELIWVDITP
ncbi:hypothetical protein GCM10022254_68330 [Actinomadura meridiana]|uniref:CMP/dCMP-type deaminase domain-containing protein n=1 Tax=Actinomadura meridiana TaxID=559626 RepID=A0ABP8CMX1_9ACTN